jgi:type II secretory pathway pseudopilin PulG
MLCYKRKFPSNKKFFPLAHTSRGMSLIELVVAIGIMVLIGGAMIIFERSVLTNTKVLQTTLSSQQQIRKTLSTITAELRSACPSANSSYAIESVSTTSIVFYSNIDTDNLVERVRYFYATATPGSVTPTVLKKGVTKPVANVYATGTEVISTVVNDLKNSSTTPIFSFYDSYYTGVASSTAPLPPPFPLGSIRLIKVLLAVDPNAARSPVYHTYDTQVSIRFLKDNL